MDIRGSNNAIYAKKRMIPPECSLIEWKQMEYPNAFLNFMIKKTVTMIIMMMSVKVKSFVDVIVNHVISPAPIK
ncbi:hypothetical protein HFA01_19440 [Halobacillus faecis]|uniref:Uncharacterized protein n=1 Tax=Halobacillus faecis TaxID=360184 RepID=A0A511WWC1_9BACI|nr:hypothetical protein HFA01_19440 [Halobacillus faecis]